MRNSTSWGSVWAAPHIIEAVKAILVVCALAGVLMGVGASCGPKQSFCPNNPKLYNCYDMDAAMTGSAGTSGGPGRCPDGGSLNIDQNSVCTCMGAGIATYPCGPAS
jgi:hypothetical protein